MTVLQELLETHGYLLLDGAIGTMMMAAGLESGDPPEEWNITYPERVEAIHRQYIEAGSQVILTNTFGGTHFRLKLHDLQDQATALNRAGAEIARTAADAVPQSVAVAGSMGPTGELLEPMGLMSFDAATAAFAEQVTALAEGGVDLLWIETMSDLNEVKAAVEGARSVCDLPIAATLTFDTRGHTMMGVSPAQAMKSLSHLGLIALGANCGNGPAEIEGVIASMHQVNPSLPLIAKSNAGLPQWINNELVYDGTPSVMSDYAHRVYHLGARLVGGCCGNTPDHIRAMRAMLKNGH